MQWKQDDALALLLHAVHLDPKLAGAHVALAEMYAISNDYRAAWRHAREAEKNGNNDAVQMLERHGIAE